MRVWVVWPGAETVWEDRQADLRPTSFCVLLAIDPTRTASTRPILDAILHLDPLG